MFSLFISFIKDICSYKNKYVVSNKVILTIVGKSLLSKYNIIKMLDNSDIIIIIFLTKNI